MEYFSIFEGDHRTHKKNYRIHWIYSSEKRQRDQAVRNARLEKAEQALAGLNGKINRYQFKKSSRYTSQGR